MESGEAAFACLVDQSFLRAHGIYKHLPSSLLLIQSWAQTQERAALFILAKTETWRGLVALPESAQCSGRSLWPEVCRAGLIHPVFSQPPLPLCPTLCTLALFHGAPLNTLTFQLFLCPLLSHLPLPHSRSLYTHTDPDTQTQTCTHRNHTHMHIQT